MVSYFEKSDRMAKAYGELLSDENKALVLILRQTLKDHANAVNGDSSSGVVTYAFPEDGDELD